MARTAIFLLMLQTTAATAATPALEAPASAEPVLEVPDTSDEPFSLSGDTVRLAVPHAFSRASARERIAWLLEYWNHRFGVKFEWRGDRVFLSGQIFGREIRARFDISDLAVTGVADDPGWLWRGRAQAYVTRKLQKYLSADLAEP
jgi:hypothetical protein